jgi:MFS superfamily sulfate permease-like transporter
MISLVQLLRRASRPHVAFLGRIPGARRYSDLERHPDNEPIPGLLLFRTEAGLFYFNADYVRDTVMKRLAGMGSGVRLAICDLSTSPYVDLTGAQMLAELHKELAAVNVRLQIVEARASVRDRLAAEGVEEKVGRIGRFRSLADAVDDFLNANRQT